MTIKWNSDKLLLVNYQFWYKQSGGSKVHKHSGDSDVDSWSHKMTLIQVVCFLCMFYGQDEWCWRLRERMNYMYYMYIKGLFLPLVFFFIGSIHLQTVLFPSFFFRNVPWHTNINMVLQFYSFSIVKGTKIKFGVKISQYTVLCSAKFVHSIL